MALPRASRSTVEFTEIQRVSPSLGRMMRYCTLYSPTIDLQKEVHEDMVQNFVAYPHNWRRLLARPDSNIDHRRVPNLMVFFNRKGQTLTSNNIAENYSPGDLVTWDLGGGVASHWNRV